MRRDSAIPPYILRLDPPPFASPSFPGPATFFDMVPKRDPRVDAYIAEAAPFAQPILRHLRNLIHRGNPALTETIKWNCPFFLYEETLFCSFAAFKSHAGLNFHHQGMEDLLTRRLGRTNEAMGLLGRLTQLSDLPADGVLLGYIKTATKLHDSGQPRRPKSTPRPPPPVPADLSDALKRNPKAAGNWTGFSSSARREYIEWIAGAKRPETREKRLLTTVEWVAAGKPRNWKYQNC